MSGACGRHGGGWNAEKHAWRELLVKPGHKWEDNIRMDVKCMSWKGVIWIILTFGRDKCWNCQLKKLCWEPLKDCGPCSCFVGCVYAGLLCELTLLAFCGQAHPNSWYSPVEIRWNTVTHGRGSGVWKCQMQWVASTAHTTSEHCVSSITTADAHTSVASNRLNWLPPADLNGLFLCAEKRNLVSPRVSSYFKCSLHFFYGKQPQPVLVCDA